MEVFRDVQKNRRGILINGLMLPISNQPVSRGLTHSRTPWKWTWCINFNPNKDKIGPYYWFILVFSIKIISLAQL